MESPVDTISILFYADWCKPCQRVKPFYYDKVRPMYIMNGITTYEYNYDLQETKVLMEKFGVKTIPTLCVIDLKEVPCDPSDIKEDTILNILTMDSSGIEKKWDVPLLTFSLKEDF